MKAFDLFAEKGFASLTMRQLAEGLGVSTGTLYHYFPSKEALFWQLVAELTLKDIADMGSVVGSAQTVADQLQAMMEYHARNEAYFVKQLLLAIEFYQQQGRNTIIQDAALKQICDPARQQIAEMFGVQDRSLIDFGTCFLNGLILTRFFEGDEISFEQQGDLFVKMMTLYMQQQDQASCASDLQQSSTHNPSA